jgi:hypothetical protein
MMIMPENSASANVPEVTAATAKDRILAIPHRNSSAQEPVPELEERASAEVKKSRSGLLQNLGKLKPLLPILSGGLRMIDHGAVQALAQVLNLASGAGASQSIVQAAQGELHQKLEEIESGHRELRLQVQDQAVEMERIKDQIVLLRQSVEDNSSKHAELVENVRSLGTLVRMVSVGLGILLVVLITLTVLLLTRHQ